jgi:hypothetical protein
MKCHEAIEEVLRTHGRGMRAAEIAEAINAASLYSRKDGAPLPAYQVTSVAHGAEGLFDIVDGLISLCTQGSPELAEDESGESSGAVVGSRITCGIAGEHFVAAELAKRGWIVALTAKNTADVDLLVRRASGSAQFGLQIKTRRPSYRYAWRVPQLRAHGCEFIVFVDLGELDEAPEFWVVPFAVAQRLVRSEQIRTADIAEFRGAWEKLDDRIPARS